MRKTVRIRVVVCDAYRLQRFEGARIDHSAGAYAPDRVRRVRRPVTGGNPLAAQTGAARHGRAAKRKPSKGKPTR